LSEKKEKIAFQGIHLERYFFIKTLCNANMDYSREEKEKLSLQVSSVLMNNREKKNRWKISLSVGLSQKVDRTKILYDFDLSLTGLFICPGTEELEEKKIRMLAPVIYVNGSSILFATAREYLRNITSAGPYGPVILPGHNFRPTDLERHRDGLKGTYVDSGHSGDKVIN
jgi:preprotein translocase subunit SecB